MASAGAQLYTPACRAPTAGTAAALALATEAPPTTDRGERAFAAVTPELASVFFGGRIDVEFYLPL